MRHWTEMLDGPEADDDEDEDRETVEAAARASPWALAALAAVSTGLWLMIAEHVPQRMLMTLF